MNLEIPSKLSQITTMTKFEFLKYIRGKKLIAMLALGFLIPVLVVSLQESLDFPEPSDVEIYLFGLFNTLFFVQVIAVAFFGSGTLVSEFHGKTGFTLFPNPIGRTSIWFGKFLAAEMASFLVIGVYYSVISISAFLKYNALPNEILTSLLFSFLVTSALMCIAFLASSVFRSPTSALVIMIILFIVVLPMIDQVLISFGETKPWFTPSFSSGIISNVLKTPYPVDLEEGQLPRGPFDFDVFVPYVTESVAIYLLYIFSCGILSIIFFKKREMI